MNKYILGWLYLVALSIFCTQSIVARNARPPRLTVVFVVDQFAHHYIDKLYPHFKYGLKYLIDHGVCFTNAHMPHGQPGTATGHAALSTGTYAKDHGYVSNTWYENGEKVACDDDDSDDARVISPDGLYDYGKSPHRLMVDTLSDQCVLQSEPNSTFTAYSISGKSRSAIPTAGRVGKALWFDCKTGRFTSSKAYFDELPKWVEKFNDDQAIEALGSVKWQRMYQKSPYAYQFFNINNYEYTRAKKTMMDRPLAVPDIENGDNPYHWFEKTPYANKYILDCSLECIKNHVSRKTRDRLLLWVCLSPLDKVAHQYGPNSMEAIDMIYHLDKQIQRFIRKTLRVIGKHELIFAVTADHGIMPIPELLEQDGFTQAQRIDRVEFIKNINDELKQNHSCGDIVKSYKGQELVLDMPEMEKFSDEQQRTMTSDIKACVLKDTGIKNAWTMQDLTNLATQPHTLEDNIKKQLFPGRTGSVVIQPYPYTVITHWKQGAAHKTPYNYDTHVPLIIFYPGKFERRYVRQRVTTLQLPNTLAEVLNIPKPSASTCEILPELFDPEYK